MKGKKDLYFIQHIVSRFIEANERPVKNALVHMTIIRCAASLIMLRELYDIHNRDRRVAAVWKQIEDDLARYDLTVDRIAKIAHESELSLTLATKNESAAKTAVDAVSNFVNPFNCDREAFCKYLTERTHATLQQSVGGLFFQAIRKWASTPDNRIDPRSAELAHRCKMINTLMKARDPNWEKLPLI